MSRALCFGFGKLLASRPTHAANRQRDDGINHRAGTRPNVVVVVRVRVWVSRSWRRQLNARNEPASPSH